MRVLALVPGGINDQLQFFPTLTTIQAIYPNAEISVVVEPDSKSAYRVSKAVSEVIPFNYRAQNSPADWANLLGIIRDREFELVLSASDRWEEAVLLWLSGIPTRIGYSTAQVSWLYSNTVIADKEPYSSGQYQALLHGLANPSQPGATVLNVPEADIAWAEEQRKTLGLTGSGYVVMYPGINAQADGYPLDSWLSIIDDFQSKQPQLPVVLLETVDSEELVASISRQRKLKIVNAKNLGQVAAILAGADLVISPDSYISQVAMALQVFTLVLQTSLSPELPPVKGETRVLGIRSTTAQLADLKPGDVLQKVWGG
ncbi:glycosyl transferase family 9 [Leptolyngbya sp. Heron Island J]|uniref:glycosyltransferase family 9 protein n=1 Tax=Leptolyngbya sp. Heron Island J TaxID=1385935 RepID=UPI0003B9D418|nr:glycosyltransferase family 9 protein [Leptolyngbya sp. Heron Island J]ESA33102.1 glycosyl transferase family 9 [Leptolyngbya sp. Heron Island J]